MSTGVMITLIICITIILLFGTIMIAAVALSKQKKRDESDNRQVVWRDPTTPNLTNRPKYGRMKDEEK